MLRDQLHSFQLPGHEVTVNGTVPGKGFAYYDTGLGKTYIECAALETLGFGPTLVLGGKKGQGGWRRHINGLLDDWGDVRIAEGTATQRQAVIQSKPDALIISYDSFLRDYKADSKAFRRYTRVICDEAHRLMNHKTKARAAVYDLIRATEPTLGMASATAVNKGPMDLWSYLNLMDPSRFRSYWKFLNEYCIMLDGRFGKEYIGPKNTDKLKELIAGYLVRKKDTDPDVQDLMPKRNRMILPAEMSPEMKVHYRALLEDLMSFTIDDMVIAPNEIAAKIKLRQLLACPRLIDPSIKEWPLLDSFIGIMEEANDYKAVIYTPFRNAVDHIEKHLAAYKIPTIGKLRSGVSVDYLDSVEKAFRAADKGVVICTVLYSESFELESAKRGFFCGFEWNFNTNYQAEGRISRLTSKGDRRDYYYGIHNDTLEWEVMHKLGWKKSNVNAMGL